MNYICSFLKRLLIRKNNKIIYKSKICSSAGHEGLCWTGGIAPLILKT